MADIPVAALDQREDTRMNAGAANGRVDCLRDDLAGAGMGRMSLDHDRATSRQRSRRVATCRRESQRKIRGAKHRDRADGPLHQADFRARRRLAVRQSRVEAAVKIIAIFDMAGKQPELAGRAAAFADQAGFRQAGLLAADFGDRIGAYVDLVGDGAQERGARAAIGFAKTPERILGSFAGAIDQLCGSDGELMNRAFGWRRGEGAVTIQPFAGDKVFSAGDEGHGQILLFQNRRKGRICCAGLCLENLYTFCMQYINPFGCYGC